MIAQTIQLALAPVFVLVAMGNILNILSTRLGRVVDRARVLQGAHMATEGMEHDLVVAEIRMIETIRDGQPSTPFMRFGDKVRIEMKDKAGHSIFGAIEQTVEKS